MKEILSKIKRVHLVGIGGVGMSGLAVLLKDKGYVVTGSDIKDSFYLRKLKDLGIEIYIGHRRENINNAELVCFSSAIKEDNIEILEAKRWGLPLVRRAQLLGAISSDKQIVAVSGSHGKTTISSLLAYTLSSLGYKPAAFIGAQPLNYESLAWWGPRFFVIEADESDASFLYYSPWISIITNIDKEHLDFYQDMEALKEAFLKFALLSQELTIGCGDDPNVVYILGKVPSLSYGFSQHNLVRAENIYFQNGLTYFDLIVEQTRFKKVTLPLLGEHNVLNSLAVVSLFSYLKEDINRVIACLEHFKGTKRRFQIKEKVGNITFVDDYAHHPTEIKMTLKAARYLQPKRLVVIFQPHRFSRTKLLWKEFGACFSLCDCLILTDIYSAGESRPVGFKESILWEELKANFEGDLFYFSKDTLSREVPSLLEEGDLVLGLGAGDINLLLDEVIIHLRQSRIKV
jgi:UDP-N-acetylmuramate--alanine ligase